MSDKNHQHAEADAPVNAPRVAQRALILAALACRGSIEGYAGQAEPETLRQRILDWLTGLKLWGEVEPNDKRILCTPLGGLEPMEAIRASWHAEGLAILAWALNRFPLPNHDEKVDPYAVTDSIWFLSESADVVIRTARLRGLEELKACRELLYAIHCRLRDFARNRGPKNFSAWVEKSWIVVLGIDAAHLIVDDDLAIDDQPVSNVKDDRVQECEWITRERHRAIIWLFEGHPIYSQTPVDT